MEQTIWKVKLSILWIFQALNFMTYYFVEFMETGAYSTGVPGSGDGGMFSIFLAVMLTLAWLPFAIKPAFSRWPILFFSFLIFIFKVLAAVGLIADFTLGIIVTETLGAIGAALIIWCAWKAPSKAISAEGL